MGACFKRSSYDTHNNDGFKTRPPRCVIIADMKECFLRNRFENCYLKFRNGIYDHLLTGRMQFGILCGPAVCQATHGRIVDHLRREMCDNLEDLMKELKTLIWDEANEQGIKLDEYFNAKDGMEAVIIVFIALLVDDGVTAGDVVPTVIISVC